MKTFGEKILARNFQKRFKDTALIALILLLVSVCAFAALFHTQISEAINYEAVNRKVELTQNMAAESGGAEGNGRDEHGEGSDERGDGEDFFAAITPPSAVSLVIMGLLAAAFAAVIIFYWLSVAEWLYKAAAENGLNRALWPILGVFTNIIAVLALLIIVNNPKRTANSNV